ncbi:P-loop NTPase family protein [Desertihabitans brevis]|uniref:hypothetical protein n=1 Tax=Desertihabitans brevis TaxID=2268447 RepID=UPI0018F4B57C|nr:hypothetical protein [Desertihabitans brevis]
MSVLTDLPTPLTDLRTDPVPAGAARTGDLDPDRVARAKHAYTTRRVSTAGVTRVELEGVPAAGDLVLARVVSVGQHPRLELRDGRRASLFPGDDVVVCYGARYAPDQFHAGVPDDLAPCHLVAAGGLAGRVESAHDRMGSATTLEPTGLLLDAEGRRINLRSAALPPAPAPARRPVTVAVVGASMNAGKTTSAAHLVRGLRLAGLRVGAAKVTGTGAGGDVWLLGDAGADPVYDFTSAGVPTTYRTGPAEVRRIFTELTDRLAGDGCDVVVLEVADGLFHEESATLLTDPRFIERVDGVLFAARDALGAAAGSAWLRERGLPVLGLSGVLTASPLAVAEAEAATSEPLWSLPRLGDPSAAAELFHQLAARR